MGKPRLTKIERATKMINQGASTATIVKSLTVSPQYVYNLRSRLRNTGTVINKKPEQLTLELEPATPAPIKQEPVNVTPTPALAPEPENIFVRAIKRVVGKFK
jgi:hypothetical protein